MFQLNVVGVSERTLRDAATLTVKDVNRPSSKPLCSIKAGLHRVKFSLKFFTRDVITNKARVFDVVFKILVSQTRKELDRLQMVVYILHFVLLKHTDAICCFPQAKRSCGAVQMRHLLSLYRGDLQVTLETRSNERVTLAGLIHEVAYDQNSFQAGHQPSYLTASF